MNDRASPLDDTRALYETTASQYAKMMDAEIDLPMYTDVLGRLAKDITPVEGPVLDVACGPGHMLERYRSAFDQARPLIGLDLSPSMVDLANARLADNARVEVGDMRALKTIDDASIAAVINYFALHHVDADDAARAIREYARVLRPGGRLVVGVWEGSGAIDYGGHADLVALRFSEAEVHGWAEAAGLRVTRCVVEDVPDMPMDAVYLECTR